MTESEMQEFARLTVQCSKIAEILQKGLEVAGQIVGPPSSGKDEQAVKQSDNLLGDLRHLVDTIDYRAETLLGQLDCIRNQF